jgi:L-arabinose transport system substrate-binding protein
MFKKALGTLAFALAFSGAVSAEEVKIGFLVKQAGPPTAPRSS